MSKVQLTLNIICNLVFLLNKQGGLKEALQAILRNNNEVRFCQKMLVSSTTLKDFPLSDTLEAFEKFYIGIERSAYQLKFFLSNSKP